MIRSTRSVFVLLLTASAMVSTPSYASSGLSGYWQHESEPVWIEMQPDEGKGVMLRNDNRPDRVGFLVVTDWWPAMTQMNGPRRFMPRRWVSIATPPSPWRATI